MNKVAVFDIDEVVPCKDGTTMVILTLVDDDVEDEEVFPAISAVKCETCGDMVRDVKRHHCFW